MTAVSDDFNRANSTGLGGNWTGVSGSMNVASNAAVTAGSLAVYSQYIYSATAIGNGTNAVYAEIGYSVNAGGSFTYPGVLLSESGSSTNDCYRVSFGTNGDNTAYITRVVGGTSTDIATVAHTPSGTGTLRIEWDPADDSITFLVSGVEILSTTDTNVTPSYGGVHTYNGGGQVTYDNFAGDTLGAGATTSAPTGQHVSRFRHLLVR